MKIALLILSLLLSLSATAQQFTVSADKVDVLYMFITNPITVVSEGCTCADMVIEADNARLNVQPEPCKYDIVPFASGILKLRVYKKTGATKTLLGEKEFRVKRIPSPIAKVGGKSEGTMHKSMFCSQLGVIAQIENFDINARYPVSSFTVVIVRSGNMIFERKCVGPRFDTETYNAFSKMQSGDKVVISDIKARAPDTKLESLNDVVITII